MLTFFALAAVAAVFVMVAAAVLVGFVIRAVLWAVLLPLRLLSSLVFGLIGVALGIVAMPLLLVGGVIAAVVATLALGSVLVALVVSLLPLALLGLAGWAVYAICTGAVRRHPSRAI